MIIYKMYFMMNENDGFGYDMRTCNFLIGNVCDILMMSMDE